MCSKYTNTHRPTNPGPNDEINIHILVRALQRNRTPVRAVCVCLRVYLSQGVPSVKLGMEAEKFGSREPLVGPSPSLKT